MPSYCKKNSDQIVLALVLVAAASWICFVVGFGLESNNPDRPENWSEGVEKFTWYCFAFVGAMAVALVILHVAQKQTSGLAWSLFFTAVALLMAGGPLNDSGHYIWKCHHEDFALIGCQEESYDNNCMMFSSILIYSICMVSIILLTTMFENKPRFSLRGSRGLDDDLMS